MLETYKKIKKQLKEKYRYCNLYVKNLPDNFDDMKLCSLFSPYGKIISAKTVRKDFYQSYLGINRFVKVFGYVCFTESRSAKEAKTILNGSSQFKNFQNLKNLYVDYHQYKTDRVEILKLSQLNQLNTVRKTEGYKGNNAFIGNEMVNNNMLIKQMQMEGCKNYILFHLVKPQFMNFSNNLRTFPPQEAQARYIKQYPMNYQQLNYSQQPIINRNIQINKNIVGQTPSNSIKSYQVQNTSDFPDLTKMDSIAKRDYFGEILYDKISSNPNFASFSK